MIRDLLLIGIGGGAGSICRYLLGSCLSGGDGAFPAGTFAVNLLGSLLIGAGIALFDREPLRLLLVIGFCGGFTTFSTFAADTVVLLQKGACGMAAVYAAGSVATCLAATAAGWWIGSKIGG